MNSSLPFERLSDSRTLLPFDCGDEDIYQHTGDSWGTKIIDYIKHWMVSENKTGCRFITVDAYCSAVPFYLKNGFMFMGTDERLRYESGTAATVAMYYDLKHIC